jgi:hypothetical protein
MGFFCRPNGRTRTSYDSRDSMNGSPRRMNNQSFAFFGYVLIFSLRRSTDRPESVLTHPLAWQFSSTADKWLKTQRNGPIDSHIKTAWARTKSFTAGGEEKMSRPVVRVCGCPQECPELDITSDPSNNRGWIPIPHDTSSMRTTTLRARSCWNRWEQLWILGGHHRETGRAYARQHDKKNGSFDALMPGQFIRGRLLTYWIGSSVRGIDRTGRSHFVAFSDWNRRRRC